MITRVGVGARAGHTNAYGIIGGRARRPVARVGPLSRRRRLGGGGGGGERHGGDRRRGRVTGNPFTSR